MFSLIVALIAIVLVAAIAAATMYFGGSTFTQGQARAQAVTVVNAGAQIAGAVAAYTANTASPPANLTTLVTSNFLTALPSGSWVVQDNYVSATDLTEDQCAAANAVIGVVGVPTCASLGETSACCSI
jgi:type II secretory pathway pseudopilin PulG